MFTVKKYEANGQRLGARSACKCPKNFVGDVVKYTANQQLLGACGSCGGHIGEVLSFSGDIESINFVGDVEKRSIMVANSTLKSSDNVSDASGETKREDVATNVQKIKKDVELLKKQGERGEVYDIIQVAAVGLAFAFSIFTLKDLIKNIK